MLRIVRRIRRKERRTRTLPVCLRKRRYTSRISWNKQMFRLISKKIMATVSIWVTVRRPMMSAAALRVSLCHSIKFCRIRSRERKVWQGQRPPQLRSRPQSTGL